MQRTEHAIQDIRTLQQRTDDAIFRHHPEQKPVVAWTDAVFMKMSMQIGIGYYEYTEDLKVAVFKNLTSADFVTCDHPAVITNRFHLQRLNDTTFGISNSGVILLMPLSPQLCAVYYDGGVYSVANASGTPFVGLSRESDVRAVNGFQYLNASHNIYFSRWEDRDDVAQEATKVGEERSKAKSMATIFVRDYTSHTTERYRKGTPQEEATAQEAIVAASFQHPTPSSWPSQIRFRDRPKMFSNGSAIGYVRKPEWLVSRRERV